MTRPTSSTSLLLLLLFLVSSLAAAAPPIVSRFVHISDFHTDPLYNPRGNRTVNYCRTTVEPPVVNGTQLPARIVPFGQYGCDSPPLLTKSSIDIIKKIEPKPDFLLVTGDSAAHKFTRDNDTIVAMNITMAFLRATFPTTPVVLTIGNNDCVRNYVQNNTPNDPWLGVLYDIYKYYLPASARSTFLYGGYYTHDISAKLSVLSLNTILFATRHTPTLDPATTPDPLNQFAWLRSELERAKTQKRAVYIIGHIAPGSNIWNNEELWHEGYTRTYIDIARNYSSIIIGQFYGHMHRDDLRVIWPENDRQEASLVILEAPSIAPNSDTNPSFRFYYYNTSNYALIDYDEYYTDIINNYISGEIHWRLEYSFNEAYNETDLSADSINNMYRKMQRDPAMFLAWLARRVSQYSPSRFEYYCAMGNLYRDQYMACMRAVTYFIGALPKKRMSVADATGLRERRVYHEHYPPRASDGPSPFLPTSE